MKNYNANIYLEKLWPQENFSNYGIFLFIGVGTGEELWGF